MPPCLVPLPPDLPYRHPGHELREYRAKPVPSMTESLWEADICSLSVSFSTGGCDDDD